MGLAREICQDCGKVFMGGPRAFLCKDCRKKRVADGKRRAKEKEDNGKERIR